MELEKLGQQLEARAKALVDAQELEHKDSEGQLDHLAKAIMRKIIEETTTLVGHGSSGGDPFSISLQRSQAGLVKDLLNTWKGFKGRIADVEAQDMEVEIDRDILAKAREKLNDV